MSKHLRRAVFGAAMSVAMIAAAFFASTYISEGSREAKTGKGSNVALPVNISFPDGQLTPSNPVQVTATVDNTSGAPRVWKGFTMSIETPTVPACQSWLELYPERSNGTASGVWQEILAGTETSPLEPISTGTQNIFAARVPSDAVKVWLRFKPALVGTTDQSSCQNAPVKVTGKLTE